MTRIPAFAFVATLVVAAAMTAASLAGLAAGSVVYPGTDAKLLTLLVGQDTLNLIVGLPLLLGSMWLARRGSLVGLLLWPGALWYVAYDYGYYVLGAPFNWFFVPYIGLVTLSVYAAIAVVAAIDPRGVRERVAAAVPERLVGGFLVGLAVLFTLLWTAMSYMSLAAGVALEAIPRVVTIMDLTLQLPALLIGGLWLWRREAIGYVVAPGLLLQAAAYLAGLSALTVLHEVLAGLPFDAFGVVPGLIVGAIGAISIGPFIRGARRPAAAQRHVVRQQGAAT